jgi:hypothetical protein
MTCGSYDKVKDDVEVTNIPKYEKIDKTPVNRPSDWDWNMS